MDCQVGDQGKPERFGKCDSLDDAGSLQETDVLGQVSLGWVFLPEDQAVCPTTSGEIPLPARR
jgi:hypothetical protein